MSVIVSQGISPYKISSGHTDSGDRVVSGGSMFVLSAGVANATTVQFRRLSDDQQRRIGKRFALVGRQRDNFRY
jgi:hypothetical protein